MQEEIETNKKDGILNILIAIVLICIITLSALYFIFPREGASTNEIEILGTVTNVTAGEASDLINNTPKLLILDVRTCKCKWRGGHIPGAIHTVFPEDFYNVTDDLLIYDQNGSKESVEFSNRLENMTNGKIYRLEKGIIAWENAGFSVVPGE
jgi:rhodanese-related sulfurtransferase